MRLKLNLFKQTPGYCGPTALRIVLDYYKIKKNELELAKIIGATRENGCDPWQIVEGVKKLGLKAVYKKNYSITKLKKLLERKIPIIVDWNPIPDHGHYSVVIGTNKKSIFLANPLNAKIESISINDFKQKWYETYDKNKVEGEAIIVEKPSKKSFRKSVFVVVYRKMKNEIEYLLLKRKKHWSGWEFPKGGIDQGETEKQTVEREVFEETGLKPKNIKTYRIKGKYNYPGPLEDRPNQIGQTYKLFSAEIESGKIKIDKREHSNYIWLKFKEAIKKLTWKDQKKCIIIVNKKLFNL